MPPREFRGQAVGPGGKADLLEGGEGARAALDRRHPLDLETVGGVLRHAPVREEGEVLEDHGDLPALDLAEGPGVAGGDVAALDPDRAGGRRDQSVQHPHEGRLARARETHDHEDLALGHVEARVLHGDGGAGLGEDRLLALALAEPLERLVSAGAEHLEEIAD
jgi:hypothetical protein